MFLPERFSRFFPLHFFCRQIKNCTKKKENYFQTEIYQKAERSQLRIHPNSAGNSILTEYMQEGEQMTMIQEKIYDEELQPILCNKHYMLTDKAVFEINTHR